jgi:hypothetical protein
MSVRFPKYRHHKGSGQALVVIKDRRIYLGKFNSPESKGKYHRCIAQLISPGLEIEKGQPDELPTINSLILGYYRYAQTYYIKNGKPTDEVYGIRAALRGCGNYTARPSPMILAPRHSSWFGRR